MTNLTLILIDKFKNLIKYKNKKQHAYIDIYIHIYIQGVPKLTLDILKADCLANLKTIFPQRKCRGTNSFRVIND